MKKSIIILLLLILCLIVYVPTGVACTEYMSGSWPSASGLRVHVYPSAIYYSSAVQPFSWNYISSKVSFSSVHCGGDSCSTCKIFIEAVPIYGQDAACVAKTVSYRRILGIPIGTTTGTWDFSIITINLNTENPLDWELFTPNEKQYVIVHELGHSLGLKEQLLSCSEDSIMYPYFRSDPPFITPRQHDKNTLISKYGN